jgi:hypothetical protein
LIAAFLESVFYGFAELFIFGTGELILWILTFGKRERSWQRIHEERSLKTDLLMELGFWVGLVFWLALFPFVYNLFT